MVDGTSILKGATTLVPDGARIASVENGSEVLDAVIDLLLIVFALGKQEAAVAILVDKTDTKPQSIRRFAIDGEMIVRSKRHLRALTSDSASIGDIRHG